MADTREQALEELPGATRAALVEACVGEPEQIAQWLTQRQLRLLIVSPGVPATGPIMQAAVACGSQVWSEIELAWRLAQDTAPQVPWLTITGTDGKTTTTSMVAQIVEAAGLKCPAVGNIGLPTITTVATGGMDALAVELSSFQLHSTHTLSPLAAACLNVAADHLDWHGSQQAYTADKARVYHQARAGAIYNLADQATLRMVEDADVVEGCRAVGFGLGVPGRGQVGLVEQVLVDRAWHAERYTHGLELATLDDLAHLAPGGKAERLPAHLVADALAAASLALAVPQVADQPQAIAQGLRDFTPGAHRLANVGTWHGVTWVDDSKATNVHATLAALSGMPPKSVVWLVGGDTKGADLSQLIAQVAPQLRAAVVLGKTPQAVCDWLAAAAPQVPYRVVGDGTPEEITARAVAIAAEFAQNGDTVLLAPAAASWDQYRSYAQRGELFAQFARQYAAQE